MMALKKQLCEKKKTTKPQTFIYREYFHLQVILYALDRDDLAWDRGGGYCMWNFSRLTCILFGLIQIFKKSFLISAAAVDMLCEMKWFFPSDKKYFLTKIL